MKIKKSNEKKIKNPLKKASAPRQSDKGEKRKSSDAGEELFGVHIISSEDIENHFGVPEKESDRRMRQESAQPGESKNEK